MIDRTKIPARYVPLLQTAGKAATLAAIIACCVSVPSLGASGEEEGAMTDPLEISDPWESSIERMYVIQDALWYYHRDNGTYPSTDEWLRDDGASADYVQWALLFDPWHERFRYQGLTEQGVVVNYRLESTGEDLASPHDKPRVVVTWFLDGQEVWTAAKNGDGSNLSPVGAVNCYRWCCMATLFQGRSLHEQSLSVFHPHSSRQFPQVARIVAECAPHDSETSSESGLR